MTPTSPPAPEARRLDPAQIAWETGRRRFCDEGCGQEVRIGVATWMPGSTVTRRILCLLCEQHGLVEAGFRGARWVQIPPLHPGGAS